MKPYTKSKASQAVKIGKFYVMVTAAVIVSTIISLYASASEMKTLMGERAEIQAQIDEEQKKQLALSAQKNYFESDSYIEEIAREKLGFVKPTDKIFVDRNSK